MSWDWHRHPSLVTASSPTWTPVVRVRHKLEGLGYCWTLLNTDLAQQAERDPRLTAEERNIIKNEVIYRTCRRLEDALEKK